MLHIALERAPVPTAPGGVALSAVSCWCQGVRWLRYAAAVGVLPGLPK
jgi:hypothetical protein